MDQSTHEIRMASWMSIIQQCQSRPVGQSAKQWLDANNIPIKRYYYWLRKARKQAYGKDHPSLPSTTGKTIPAAVSFAEIPAGTVSPDDPVPAIMIQTKKATIQISSCVEGSLMLELVKAVANAL